MIPDYIFVPFGLFIKWTIWAVPYYFAVFYLIGLFCLLYDISNGDIPFQTSYDKLVILGFFIFSPFISIFRLLFNNYRWV